MKPPQEAAQIAPLLVVSYSGHLCVVRESGIVPPQLPPPPAEALRRDLSLALLSMNRLCSFAMFCFSPCYAVGLEPGQVFIRAPIQHRNLGCVFIAAMSAHFSLLFAHDFDSVVSVWNHTRLLGRSWRIF